MDQALELARSTLDWTRIAAVAAIVAVLVGGGAVVLTWWFEKRRKAREAPELEISQAPGGEPTSRKGYLELGITILNKSSRGDVIMHYQLITEPGGVAYLCEDGTEFREFAIMPDLEPGMPIGPDARLSGSLRYKVNDSGCKKGVLHILTAAGYIIDYPFDIHHH